MSLKCSLFGHDFGEAEVEREREEQGSEVVITITETETCSRCGEERVVSENKEVTTLETPADIVGDDLEDADAPAEPPAGSTAGDRREGTEPTDTETATAGGAEPAEVGQQPQGSSVPDVEEDVGPEPTGTEESTGAEESVGPEPGAAEDDGVILDKDDGEEETDDGARAPGEWPEEDDGEDDEWAPETDRDLGPEETEVESTSDAVTVPEGTFHCPECDFSTPVESSSLREGDFCPECHRGSLEHRSE